MDELSIVSELSSGQAKLEEFFLGKRRQGRRKKKDRSCWAAGKEIWKFGHQDLPPLSGSQCSGLSLHFS